MADYLTSGVHVLNGWLWSQMKDWIYKGSTKAFAAYGSGGDAANLVPIIPTQQVPEFTNIVSGAPFIVYNYTSMANNPWWIDREQTAYMVYDDDEERLRAIYNYMRDLLKRQDWTAAAVNSSLNQSPFDFKSITVTTATGPGVAKDEGGRHNGLIVVNYTYTHSVDGQYGSGLRA